MSDRERPGTVSDERRSPPPSPAPAGPADDAEDPVLLRARNGDRDAFRELVERHQDKVFGFVLRVLRCDRHAAADFAQEVFLRVFRGLPGYDGGSRFVAWLQTITMNVCVSEIRRRRTLKRGRTTLSLDAPIAGTEDLFIEPRSRERDPSDRVHGSDVRAAVEAAVAQLPDEFREAVLMRDLQGLSYEEIGALLGVPPGTVRSRIHRGRAILQGKLEAFRP